MKTVKEVSRITGVSVRTLHHYDAIGLLKPTAVTEAGYRLYGDAALKRMQSILFFRELQFPLKDIKRILDGPGFDPAAAPGRPPHLRSFLPADTMNLTRDAARKAAEQLDPAEPTACEAASGGI